MSKQNLEAHNMHSKVMETLNSLFVEQQKLWRRVERLEKIMEQLVYWEKIEQLEKEKAALLTEMESLKEKGEAKSHKLVNEVSVLRKEVKALKKLLKTSQKNKLDGGNS